MAFRLVLFFSVSFAICLKGLAAPPVFSLSLKQAEELAQEHSPRVQAAQVELASAEAQTKARFAALWPRLSFGASYRHVSEVPSFQPAPNALPVKLGDNKNYSYGPEISWLAWDSGALTNRWRSAEARRRSKKEELELARRQLVLETRLDYFQVQLGLEQVRLLADSVKLAQAQYKDINLQRRAGTVSRIDSLQAHEEVLNRRRLLRQAQADLASALSALFAVTGSSPPAEPSVPLANDIKKENLPDADPPTLRIDLDPLRTNLVELQRVANKPFDVQHPELRALSELIEAAKRTSASVQSGHGPSLQISGRLSRDYPNGPVLESFNQKTLGLTATWPLFEWGRVKNETLEQTKIAEGTERRLDQKLEDLRRTWNQARGQRLGLLSQQNINQQSVSESEELARLIYESYRAGRSTYLEVETANLKALESKITAARTNTQLLIQLAVLDSLSSKE